MTYEEGGEAAESKDEAMNEATTGGKRFLPATHHKRFSLPTTH
jgi:hypothetical protein